MIDGYKSAAGSQWPHIVTSCAVASAAALLSLAVAAPCAYALVVFRMRWTTLFILLMLIAQMLPHIVMANALYAIYARLGLLDTYYGLILANSTMGVPFAILILRAFIASLPAHFSKRRYATASAIQACFSTSSCRSAVMA